MATRKIVFFKIKNEVVVEERREMTPKEIEAMKWVVAEECDVPIFDVDAEVYDTGQELSEIEVTTDGLLDWKDVYFRNIIGIKMDIALGSDEHLDSINNGSLIDYLSFTKS